MKRRNFFKTSLLATPILWTGCTSPVKTSAGNAALSDHEILLLKVKQAMLAMQRASWEQGVAAQSLLESGDTDLVLLMAKEAVLRQLPDGRLAVLYTDNGVTDPAASGEAVLFAANHLNDEKMHEAASRMFDYLMTTPHRTAEGILHHTINAPEIWIDAMYMAPPFLAAYGYVGEAVKQIEGFRKALWNNQKKLYSHRYDTVKNEFVSKKFWGVGNGWALTGMTRVISRMPDPRMELKDALKSEKQRMIGYVREHLNSCLSYMRDDGLFHNNIDEPDTFVETNLSQMIAYTIYTGIHGGWLDESYRPAAEKMYSAALSRVDELGFVQGVCGAPYFNAPGRATEGQAFFLLMEASRGKAMF